MKKYLICLIALIFNLSSYSFEIDLNKSQLKFLEVYENKTFTICKNKKDNCIRESSVLNDLYPKTNISVVSNFGMIDNKYLTRISNGIKFNDGSDLYALFIVQSNNIDAQGLPTCHGCAPMIGISMYQFHNKWKLFAANKELTSIGSYGNLELNDKEIELFKISSEKFLLTIKSNSMGQGYESSAVSLFLINSDFLSSIETTSTVEIKYVGFYKSALSECNAKKDGSTWVSSPTYQMISPIGSPKIELSRIFKSCKNNSFIKKDKIILTKLNKYKEFISEENK